MTATVAARLFTGDGRTLGVRYAYSDGSQDAHPIGPDDWPQIRALDRAGALPYDSNKAASSPPDSRPSASIAECKKAPAGDRRRGA